MKKLTHHSAFSKQLKMVNHLQLFINFFTLILFILISGTSFSQTAPVLIPKGGFKIDGHLRANVTTVGGDWLPRLNTQKFSADVDSFVINV